MNLQKIKLIFSIAVQGLKTNKGRTILTTIGIMIGIATIVIVLTAGRGLEKFILKEIETFGADTIEVEVKIPSVSDTEMAASIIGGAEVTTLTVDDFEAMKDLPNVADYYAALLGQYKSVYKERTDRSMVYAISPSVVNIDKELKLEEGRFFSERENSGQARVAVLGSEVKKSLFDGENPVGQTIKMNQISFKVIGVVEPRGGSAFFNYDEMIYVPLNTGQKQLLGVDHVMFGFLSMDDTTRADETVADLNSLLRRRHGLPPNDPDKDDFRVTSMQEALEIVGTVTFGMTLLVLAIAGISLVVGGVGIMNIMYLSVVERTREIGLRKAIGAANGTIQLQFLVEAILITALGGIMGIVLGSAIIIIIDIVSQLQGFDFDMTITIDAILIGFASAITFGILFGLYPARKASELSPVDALRYE
ncbi:MAG: ABC transporter permease [Candidatus Gracilibacteria bacterium]|nr:ABC transporter permease [Candidatus Peregrinibacteria bacterium]